MIQSVFCHTFILNHPLDFLAVCTSSTPCIGSREWEALWAEGTEFWAEGVVLGTESEAVRPEALRVDWTEVASTSLCESSSFLRAEIKMESKESSCVSTALCRVVLVQTPL